MSNYSEQGKESMRILTNKIIAADLASKKIRMNTIKGRLLFSKWFYMPMSLYSVYVGL